jgi:hypothetical protein
LIIVIGEESLDSIGQDVPMKIGRLFAISKSTESATENIPFALANKGEKVV